MSLIKNTVEYNGETNLVANAGDWVDGEIIFNQLALHIRSESSNKCTYLQPSIGLHQMEFQSYDWAANGWQVGDNCSSETVIVVTPTFGTAYLTTQVITFTILSISNNTVNITPPIISNPLFPLIPNTFFPGTIETTPSTRWEYQALAITGENKTEQIDFSFNLARDGTQNLKSVIDGELSNFYVNTVGHPLYQARPMIQTNNKSGSLFKEVTLTKVDAFADKSVKWAIRFKFLQWGIIEDGFTEPNYYSAGDNLATYAKVSTWGNISDPNTIRALEIPVDADKVVANTGGYNENYNGKPNHFTVDSIDWFDVNGNPISALNYSGTSSFKAIVSSPNTSNLDSIYRIGLVWRPEDSSFYKNKLTNLGENLLLNAPDVDFVHNPLPLPFPVIQTGYVDPSGAEWSFKNVKFTHIGLNKIQIIGIVIPNGDANTLFSGVPNGGRRSTLWISIADPTTTITGTDRVSLILWDDDNIDAPTLGVQIPNIVDEFLYDHDRNDITSNQSPNTTTEDDVQYEMNLLLPKNVTYDGIRFKIQMFNNQNGDTFDLENRYLSFGNVITQGGVMQLNEIESRNFNLPPTTDRNDWSIVLNPALDTGTHYGVSVGYGFLNDWRYWLSQSNVNNDFYSLTEPNNGKNKDWQHYDVTDWFPRVAIFTDLNGIEDFNYLEYNIRPYEDDIDVVATTVLKIVSTGAIITALIPNEIIEIETTFVWNQNFTDEWAEFTIEDFEGGNRWVISSVLDQGGVAANPLEPITGFTKIDVSGTGTSTLVCKALVDTSVITANKVSLSFRVYSSPNEVDPDIVGKQKTDNTLKEKTDNTVKQKA